MSGEVSSSTCLPRSTDPAGVRRCRRRRWPARLPHTVCGRVASDLTPGPSGLIVSNSNSSSRSERFWRWSSLRGTQAQLRTPARERCTAISRSAILPVSRSVGWVGPSWPRRRPFGSWRASAHLVLIRTPERNWPYLRMVTCQFTSTVNADYPLDASNASAHGRPPERDDIAGGVGPASDRGC